MNAKALSTWLSDDPEALERQLAGHLDQLKNGDAAAAAACRAALEYAMAKVWQSFARGELGAPRKQLKRFKSLALFVQTQMPHLTSVQEIAVEVFGALESLHLAGEVADELGSEDKIRNEKAANSPTARAVLGVLRGCSTDFLRRGQVSDLLSNGADRTERPVTNARVGQILETLYETGLVQRTKQPGRGGSISYYRLSARGGELCQKFGIDPAPAWQAETRRGAHEAITLTPQLHFRRNRYQIAGP